MSDAYRPVNRGIASTAAQPDRASLKRLAWAFGCAPKGSQVEADLERHLLARAATDAMSRVEDLEHRLASLNKAPTEGVGP